MFAGFQTTPMEMEAVANIFDRDGDGFIDYKEFVSALRPNRDVSNHVDNLFVTNIQILVYPKFVFTCEGKAVSSCVHLLPVTSRAHPV